MGTLAGSQLHVVGLGKARGAWVEAPLGPLVVQTGWGWAEGPPVHAGKGGAFSCKGRGERREIEDNIL